MASSSLEAQEEESAYDLYTEADDLKRRAWGWSAATFLRFALDPETEDVTLVDAWPDKGEVVLRLRGPVLEDGERAEITYALSADDESLKDREGAVKRLMGHLALKYRGRPENHRARVKQAAKILGVRIVL